MTLASDSKLSMARLDRVRSAGRGQGHREPGPLAELALHVDGAAAVVHDPLHDREAQAGAGLRLRGVERFEYPAYLRFADPDTVIRHLQHARVAAHPCLDADHAPLTVPSFVDDRVSRVADQV